MPELPEVETVRRGLEAALLRRVIESVQLRREGLRRPFPDRLPERLAGVEITAVRRRAKYLLIDTSRDESLLVHLGMSGCFVLDASVIERHDHVLFTMRDGGLVVFRDPRRFGLMDIVATPDAASHPLLGRLGPEPLGNAFNGDCLARAVAGRRGPIKTILLDQTVIAGLGNIYVCEALWQAGLSPLRRADRIARPRLHRLARAVVSVLREAIAAGGASLRDHRRVDGELGCFQHDFNVYGRSGSPCPRVECRGSVRRIVQSGRSTHYCPTCQR